MRIFLLLLAFFFVLFFDNAEAQKYYDLDSIDLKVSELEIIHMVKNPKDPFDDSDVVLLRLDLTNNGNDYFVISAKMFKIRVIQSSYPGTEYQPHFKIIDNYFTAYNAELETRFKDFRPLKTFKDCEYMNDRVFLGGSKSFGICYDVKQRWSNEPLVLGGSKKYFLTLMDNAQTTSCPNCINIMLTNDMIKPDDQSRDVPFWIKDYARKWTKNQIVDSTYLKTVDFLINEKFINIPNMDQSNFAKSPTTMPDWIKNYAWMWVNGKIDDASYLNWIKFFVERGIIRA